MIVSVLKSGGEYKAAHVNALFANCAAYLPKQYFLCLTDAPEGLNCAWQLLEHNWRGWWSKIEVFRLCASYASTAEPLLFLDLDTILVNDCSALIEAAANKDFVVLRDFYRGRHNGRAMGSGVMAIGPKMQFVYDTYLRDGSKARGDQDFLEEILLKADCPISIQYWQDLVPGIISFKGDLLGVMTHQPRGLQPSDKLVAFHGKPRPWEQDLIPYGR